MGKIIKVTGATFSGDVLRNDQRLTPGSLALIDFSHGLSAPGVPANSDSVFNVAYRELSAITGVSESSESLHHTFLNTFTGAEGAFEKTAKGALHGAVSRTSQGGHYARINNTQQTNAAIDWIADNPSREYAVFLWGRVTRAALSNSANLRDAAIGSTSAFTSNNLFSLTFTNSSGLQRVAANKTGWNGSPGTAAQNVIQIAWGNISPMDPLVPNDGRSYILYGFHVIDVAASGMSYAELNARDADLFAAAFSEGGRFYNDSWTDPAELLDEPI